MALATPRSTKISPHSPPFVGHPLFLACFKPSPVGEGGERPSRVRGLASKFSEEPGAPKDLSISPPLNPYAFPWGDNLLLSAFCLLLSACCLLLSPY